MSQACYGPYRSASQTAFGQDRMLRGVFQRIPDIIGISYQNPQTGIGYFDFGFLAPPQKIRIAVDRTDREIILWKTRRTDIFDSPDIGRFPSRAVPQYRNA